MITVEEDNGDIMAPQHASNYPKILSAMSRPTLTLWHLIFAEQAGVVRQDRVARFLRHSVIE